MQANNFLRRLITQTTTKRSYTGHHVKATYNDLPVPQGNWQTHHDAFQRKYNAQLAFGIIFALATITIGRAAGFLNLNYVPPKKPGERDY